MNYLKTKIQGLLDSGLPVSIAIDMAIIATQEVFVIEEISQSQLESTLDNLLWEKIIEARPHSVFPEGPLDASLYVLCDSPSWLDVRTEFPLTGLRELKGSRCATCSFNNLCYTKLWQGELGFSDISTHECNFTPTKIDKSFIQTTGQIRTAGELFDRALRETNWGRKPWKEWHKRMASLGYGKPVPEDLIYITHLVPSYARNNQQDQLPTEQDIIENTLWAFRERSLHKAKTMLLLGDAACKAVLGEVPKYIGSRKVKDWGKVFWAKHPRELLNFDPNSLFHKGEVASLVAVLKACYENAYPQGENLDYDR